MDWYVYTIKDPRNDEIFYVGKGTGYRKKATLNTKDKGMNFLKRAIIEDIRSVGLEPIVDIVERFNTEPESLIMEKSLIESLGRIIKGTGRLVNFADGGEDSNAGWQPTEETKKLWSEQRTGKKQSESHIKSRASQLKGKTRSEEQKHNYVLGSIRRWRPELKAKILLEVEHLPKFERKPHERGIYTELGKKFGVGSDMISKIHNNIELYKEALREWI